jgi:large subunit ribosomal protein L10
VGGDPIAAAKKLKAASKLYPALVLKGGYMDGAVLDAAGANGLADLESREVMLSKIAGMLKSEMSRAAAAFVGAQSKFLSLLEAYKEKVPAGDVAEAPADEAPSEPEASAEPEVAEAEAPETEAPETEAPETEAPEAPETEAAEADAGTDDDTESTESPEEE